MQPVQLSLYKGRSGMLCGVHWIPHGSLRVNEGPLTIKTTLAAAQRWSLYQGVLVNKNMSVPQISQHYQVFAYMIEMLLVHRLDSARHAFFNTIHSSHATK